MKLENKVGLGISVISAALVNFMQHPEDMNLEMRDYLARGLLTIASGGFAFAISKFGFYCVKSYKQGKSEDSIYKRMMKK